MPNVQDTSGSPISWRPLGTVDATALRDTRLHLHHAVQLLASFGQATLEAQDDDSHRSLTWAERHRGFESGSTGDGLFARVLVPSFAAEVWLSQERLGSLDLLGQRPSQALAWLGNLLGEARGAGAGRIAWPEYDLPEQPGGADQPLEPAPEALEELAAWYGNAQQTLEETFASERAASAIRCWPHHFDLATLLTYPAADGSDAAAYVGVGFSPGDDEFSEPYFYVNGWPPPGADALPAVTGPGAWYTEAWVGAVLGAQEIVSSGSGAAQKKTLQTFLTDRVDAMRATVLARNGEEK